MRAYVQLKKFLKKTDILHKTCNTDAGFDYKPKTAALNLSGTFFSCRIDGCRTNLHEEIPARWILLSRITAITMYPGTASPAP